MGTAKKLPLSRVGLGLGLFALALAGPAAAQGEDGDGYGYIRVLEGQATLIQAGSGDRDPAEINQPLLVGDRLIVPGRSRLEIVLADGNLLRLDGGSELILEHLADSPDAQDRATVLRLQEGNLQLVVLQDSQGEEYPRVETTSATIYVQSYGTYRVTADRNGWSEVLVRRGLAEVVTDRGESKVRADEQAVIDAQYAGVDIRPAAGQDSLERWAQRLDEDFQSDVRYVDDNLRYRAAPLNRHGTWIHYNNARYWQPRVSAGWRPYWDGRWAYTPSGLTWVSYEPWGWVPYHYGSWDYLPGYGWAWAPGRVWAPAWVYWYWGPSYTSWCPVGYYTGYYSARYGGWNFHHGVYGWAGGNWDDNWGHWNWVRNDHFGRRDQRRYAVPTDELRGRMPQVPRGVITTDTRGVKPDTWGDPGRVARVLQEKPNRVNPGRELADVTPFIARKPELPDTVVRTVRGEKPLPGTPFQPGTPGGRGTVSRGDDTTGAEKPRPRARSTDEQPQEMPGADTGSDDKPRRTVSRPAPTDDGGYAKPAPDRPSRRAEPEEKPRSSDPEGPSGSYGRSDDDKPAPRHIEPPAEEKPEPRRVEPPAEDKPAPRHIEPPAESSNDTPSEKPSRRPPAREDGGETRSYRSLTGGGLRDSGVEKPATRPERTEQQPEPRSRRIDRPEARVYERSEPRVYERPTTRSTQSTRSDEKPAPRVYERPEPQRREAPSSRPSYESRPRSTPQRDASTPRQKPEAQSSGSEPSYDKPREAPRSVERREAPQRQSSGSDGGGRSGGGRSRQKPPQ